MSATATIRRRASVFVPLREWSRLALCLTGGAITVLVTLGALWALAPLKYAPPQPAFFVCAFLLTLFWFGWVTLLVALNCWIARRIF
jgi:hypothetical protein